MTDLIEMKWAQIDLNELYWGKKMSLAEIGQLCGVTRQTVNRHMDKKNIPRRSVISLRKPTIDMERLTSEERAYLAGIFDGEGSINLHSAKYRKVSGQVVTFYQSNVEISNTSEELMVWLTRKTGLPTYRSKLRGERRKPIFYFSIGRLEDQLSFLQAVLPYLTVKRERALLGIEFCKLRIDKIRSHKASIWDREIEIWNELKRLNLRGPTTNTKKGVTVPEDKVDELIALLEQSKKRTAKASPS